MRKLTSLRRVTVYALAVITLTIQPLAVFAEGVLPEPVASEAPEAPTASTPEISAPVEPPTPAAPSEPERVYEYNERTGRWDSDKWVYNPTTRKYESIAPKPAPPESSVQSDMPSPAGKHEDTQSNNSTTTAVTSTDIKNVLDSLAASGSAEVSKNTVASSATSGDAVATATIINNVNSSVSSSENAKAATFVADVMGDVSGDIMLKPMLLKAMLEAEVDSAASNSMAIKNNTSIANDINLSAASGDASVTKNTQAGNATTGSAHTVANVVNIVNSMIAANQSFIGTINIYGNLEGDILIAPDFIPQLLASNTVADNSPFAPAKTLKVDAANTQSIINNVNLQAASGSADVVGNTSAGSATTGQADTNTVIFNMTGHEVVAKNSLLVFINVLGKWVGVIVDAPTGATSAVLGNGVIKNELQVADLSIEAENTVGITNNLNLNSLSGNALVAGNTRAGNATSGDATASANIANISNSSFGLSDWFGVLYINVFGSWLGSLGIDTEAGNRPVGLELSAATSGRPDRPIEFIPKGARALSASKIVPLVFGYVPQANPAAVADATQQAGEAVLAMAVNENQADEGEAVAAGPLRFGGGTGFAIFAAISFLGGLGLAVGSVRKKGALAGAIQDSPVA